MILPRTETDILKPIYFKDCQKCHGTGNANFKNNKSPFLICVDCNGKGFSENFPEKIKRLKKIITYVLTVSQTFPMGHFREGEETNFVNAIAYGIKIHTIRGNYELWKKRIDKINRGEAVLSVRVWTGKPYNSNQREVFLFKKVGIEKIQLDKLLGWFINDIDSEYTRKDFAKNDGLSLQDFNWWFKLNDFAEPKAIIHFTDFRYQNLQHD